MALFEATTQDFDGHLNAAEFVVVDFYRDHCGSCAYLAPFFREAANDMPIIRFVKVNISHFEALGDRYKIEYVPTIKFFRSGQEIHQAMGGMDREELNKHIAELLYTGF